MTPLRTLSYLFCLATIGCALPMDGAHGDLTGTLDEGGGRVLRLAYLVDEDAPQPAVELEYEHTTDQPPDHLPMQLVDSRVLVVDRDRTTIWMTYQGDDTGMWERTRVIGDQDLLADARLLPGDPDDAPEMGPVLVVDGEAWVLGYGWHEPIRMERAAGSPGLTDQEALEVTVLVRRLKTCPLSDQRCVVFGPLLDVQAAQDPAVPVGGWSLFRGPESPVVESWAWEPAGSLVEEPRLRIETAIVAEGDEARGVTRVLLSLGGEAHEAFRLVTVGEWTYDAEELRVGVTPLDGQFLVWAWAPNNVQLGVSRHDATTGERIGDGLSVQADTYYDPECGNVFSGTRPVPVLDGGRIGVALFWGGERTLYFEKPGFDGREVPLIGFEEVYDPHAEEVPPYLEMTTDGALR